MTSFNTLQSISSRLKELANQISKTKLSKDELAEFEKLSRKLYERAVILNYKAKEEDVYSASSHKSANPVLPFSNEVKEVEDNENTVGNTNETFVEETAVEEKTTESQKETKEEVHGNDSVEPEEEIQTEDGRVQFDFSGGFGSSHTEEPIKSTPQKSEPLNEEINDNKKDKASKETESLNKSNRDLINESMAKQREAILAQKKSAPVQEKLEEKDSDNKVSDSFYERFSKAYKAAAGDRLGTSKINSIKDGIGLNDRMLFINELFNGESNFFNETIEKLDKLENNEIALRKLSEIAASENWNKENASVDEFAHLIIRRYVS